VTLPLHSMSACWPTRFKAELNATKGKSGTAAAPWRSPALQRLLVQEEDKLAAEFELLADVAGAIAKCRQRMKKQQVLVEMLESEGRDGVAAAKTLLDGLTDSLILHQEYHQRLAIRIEQNRSLGNGCSLLDGLFRVLLTISETDFRCLRDLSHARVIIVKCMTRPLSTIFILLTSAGARKVSNSG
jgi:hypothetical protein